MAVDKPFRVIIIGAGPAGLYLAAALARANIDFVVLERYHTILAHAGAGTVLWPYTCRLMAQLGLLQKMDNISYAKSKIEVLRSGRELRSSSLIAALEERFGQPSVVCSRADIIRVCYEDLPDREKRVRPNAHVVNIETNDDGVRVHLQDGSVEEGSVVVGADGVHSITRDIIQKLTGTPPTAMTTTFRGVFGKSYGMDKYQNGVVYEMRGSRIMIQSFKGGDKVHFGVVKAVDQPVAERKVYSEEEMNQFAEEIAHLHVTPDVTFGELWANADREHARLINQQEGFAEGPWHHKRLVLLGDAVHKMTTITGQGANVALHSAAALANELRRTTRANPNPDTEQIEQAFTRYEKARKATTAALCTVSEKITRLGAWYTWFLWFYDIFVLNWLSTKPLLERFSKLMANGQILDYVPFEEAKSKMPWVNHVAEKQ